MKNWMVIFLLVVTQFGAAQYRDGSRFNGVDRSLTGQTTPSKKKPQEKVDVVELSMQKLTEELTLDSFQAAVIKQLLEDNRKEEEKIIAEDIPNESKFEKIIALREKMNAKIKGVLQPEQVEKFEKMGKKKKK